MNLATLSATDRRQANAARYAPGTPPAPQYSAGENAAPVTEVCRESQIYVPASVLYILHVECYTYSTK
ncbi:MAG: hypothetical protein WB425_02645 [Terracidiphilus sp.]